MPTRRLPSAGVPSAPPGIALEVWGADVDQVLATAIRAEQLGFDAFYYGESPPGGLNLECWTVLAALAGATSRIRLGPVIANALPTWRHPALLVHQALTVAALSGGRLDLRTGVGAAARFGRAWWGPHGIDYPGYGARLDDLVTLLDTLARLGPAAHPIPVTIAATGRRAMALAAARADRWETSFATPGELTARRQVMDELTAGRPITCSLEIDGFVAADRAAARRLLGRVRTDRAAEDLDEVLARALVGTPAEVAARITELAGAGADHLVVALHDPHDPDALEALATAVSLATGR